MILRKQVNLKIALVFNFQIKFYHHLNKWVCKVIGQVYGFLLHFKDKNGIDPTNVLKKNNKI